jgi:hypothetical protein
VRRARRRVGVDDAIARYVDDATSTVAHAHIAFGKRALRDLGARENI